MNRSDNFMKQLSRYAYANTRIRAMLSELLDEGFFSVLTSFDFQGFLDALEKTIYAKIIKNREHLTPEEFESNCIDADRQIIRKISSFFLSKNEKTVLYLLDEKYTIEQMKFALRLWKKKQFDYNLPVEFASILKAETIDDVIASVRESDYGPAIESAKENFEKTGSLYPVEISIDRRYFEKLQQAIENLLPSDRKIARNIIGAEIDRENLLWLGRIKLFYQGKVSYELAGFIPGGAYISQDRLKQMLTADAIQMSSLNIPHIYIEIIEKLPAGLFEIDRFLESVIIKQIKKAFVERPFSIGIPLGYVFLKHRETRRIISFFVSKYLSKINQQHVA